MAYKISDDCISCGACADQCPVNAIAEGDGKYEIDADACIECNARNKKATEPSSAHSAAKGFQMSIELLSAVFIGFCLGYFFVGLQSHLIMI